MENNKGEKEMRDFVETLFGFVAVFALSALVFFGSAFFVGMWIGVLLNAVRLVH